MTAQSWHEGEICLRERCRHPDHDNTRNDQDGESERLEGVVRRARAAVNLFEDAMLASEKCDLRQGQALVRTLKRILG